MLLSYVCFHLSVIDVTNTYRRYMYVLFCVRLVTRAIVSESLIIKVLKRYAFVQPEITVVVFVLLLFDLFLAKYHCQ